jgi:O-antigen ligase
MSALIGLAVLPAVVAFAIIGLRAPMHVLLPAYAGFVYFSSLITVPVGLPYRFDSVSSLLGLALTVALALRLALAGRTHHRLPASVGVWLLLLAVAVVTAVWSVSPEDSFTGLFILASLVVLFVVVALSPVDRRAVRLTETGLLIGGLVASAYGVGQALTGTLPASEEAGPRFGRDLLGANHTAAALILALVVALSRAAAAPTVRARVLTGAGVLLLLLGILLTGSRGGLIGAGVAVLVLALCGRQRRFYLGFGLLVVTAAVGVVLLQPAGVGERATREGDSGRLDIWKVGAAACQQYCLYGSGWGTFPIVYRETQASVPDAQVLLRHASFEPHNVWILVGVEAGVTGLVLLLAGMTLAVVEALRLPAAVRGPPLAALAGIFTTGIFLSNFEFKYFWMALIYVTISQHAANAPEDDGAQDTAGVATALPRA